MTQPPHDSHLWQARRFIYDYLTQTGQAPTVAQTASRLGVGEAAQLYQALDERHLVFLEPGTLSVRMAHPYSAVPTSFQVQVGERHYFANCAWDALGIPAMLHADASIETTCAQTGEPLVVTVTDGTLGGDAGLVHFALPFARWYDNLVET